MLRTIVVRGVAVTGTATFARWFPTNGDGYATSIKNALWGGTVSGLS